MIYYYTPREYNNNGKALKDLRKNVLFNKESDKVMRLQEKGNRFIIVDKQTDHEKADDQIERTYYLKIDYDPTTLHIDKVKEWATKWISRNEISKEWAKYIVNENAVPGKNSTLYKTHKPNNPVRLLTTGCNTAIENLSRFIEAVCSPLTNNIETRIKDTCHLLDIIDELNSEMIPDNTILVSFDIVNMYPSIDNDRSIAAVRDALEARENKSPSTDCIIEGLEICLRCNNSKFGSQNLLQLNGTATGAPNSCSYADLAVFDIDKNVLQAKRNTYQEIRYFGRYRHDCLALWTGSLEKYELFLMFLNSLDSNLQFTIEIGGSELYFLDLKFTLTDNKLQTTVYSKPTDSHLYLQADSCHHLPSILGIQKGIALRLRRICLTDEEYNNKSKEYKAYLIGRGYKLKNIEKSFNDVLNMSRQQSRIKKTKNTHSKNKIVFCSKYNPLGPNIKNIIQKHAHILDNCHIMQNKEIMVGYKREKNLKELLTRADPYNIINNVDDDMHAYVPCKKRCDSCTNFVVAKISFECFATKRVYKVRQSTSLFPKM